MTTEKAKDRMAKPKKRDRRGRPKKGETTTRTEEAQPMLPMDAVPPLVCPECGRGMTPKVLRTHENGDRDCQCTLNGCLFTYTPPRVRVRK